MHKLTFKKVRFVLLLILISTISFAMLLYNCCYGQISNAKTFIDYLFYSVTIFTAVGFSNMIPITPMSKIITGIFIIMRDFFIIFSLLY